MHRNILQRYAALRDAP